MDSNNFPEQRTFYLNDDSEITITETDVLFRDRLTRIMGFKDATVDGLKKKGLKSTQLGQGDYVVSGRSLFDYIDGNMS